MRDVDSHATARRFSYAWPYAATLESSIFFALSRYAFLPVNLHASAHSAAWLPHSLTGFSGVDDEWPGGAGSVPLHFGSSG